MYLSSVEYYEMMVDFTAMTPSVLVYLSSLFSPPTSLMLVEPIYCPTRRPANPSRTHSGIDVHSIHNFLFPIPA